MALLKKLGAFHFLSLFLVNSAVAAMLTHGPVVGGVDSSSAKVFLRTDQAASVKVRYATSPNFRDGKHSKIVTTSSDKDFTTIISLFKLQANTLYYLNVWVDDVLQFTDPFPSFATFPATKDPAFFKFIVLTDFANQYDMEYTYPTFTSAAQEGAQFCFIGGDFDHRNPTTMKQKQDMFKQLYDPSSVGLGDFVNGILRRMPIAHQWDDHDGGLDNCDKTYSYWNRSRTAFNRYVPAYPLPPGVFSVWQRFSYAHVDFFILDCRSQRTPNGTPDNEEKSMLDGNHLGAAGQLEWLKQGLLNSQARWKIIFSSLVTNPTTRKVDGWSEFQTEWNNLRSFIESNQISGVIFITGDLHFGAIDNGTASGFPEMSVTHPNNPGCLTAKYTGQWSEGYYINETVDSPCRGYGVVTVYTDKLRLEIKDENGISRVAYEIPDS